MFVSAFVLLNVGGFYSTLAVIVFAGIAGYWLFRSDTGLQGSVDAALKSTSPSRPKLSVLALTPVLIAPIAELSAGILAKLFVTFAGMSVILFGGGYVFIPMIQEAVVDGQHWVTQTEFIDAIALGQVTPGPILISAAFIGYKVAGVAGAAVSTIGIFAPPAIIMLIATSMLDRIKNSNAIQACLRGVRPAVIGMIFAAAVVIGSSAQNHWLSLLIFSTALVALLRFRIEVVWIIPVSGLMGLALY
jgi:chromate transporter